MYLAANTFVYEVGKVSIKDTLKNVHKLGFKYVDLAAYYYGDPTRMSESERKDVVSMFKDYGFVSSQLLLANTRKDVVSMFKDYGFVSSQLLLANTENMASPDEGKRKKTMDWMKKCTDFQLELGGKQVLICWGCGVYEATISKAESWLNTRNMIREYAEWCTDKGILIDLELDPHVYFVLNSLEMMVRMLEDVDMPNVFPNIDIGHLCITREPPKTMAKVRDKILHVHISETNTFEHTNSIIGTGNADFKAYIDKVLELGIEENCKKYGEEVVAGIEMGEPGGEVDDPERWIKESLVYLNKILPELTLS
jgi:sugar phosphate isomerase/epimerase